jgi:lipopolysaccharide biosynthesis glycosyltransferase
MLKVYIGYDPVETVAYHVCVQSILNYSSVPVSFCPVNIHNIPEFTREREPEQSNEFSFSRFMVPFLNDYEGKALFIDCDIIFRTDIKQLFDQISTEDVMCVQHHYQPVDKIKYLGAVQHAYPRKNWSSVMLFNCNQCKTLTPDYVNTATPKELHRMLWANNIGSLATSWNHLVGEYPPNPGAKVVHWTRGTPCFDGYEEQEHANEWRRLQEEVNYHA